MKVKEEDLRRELLKAINGEDLIINCARRLGIRLNNFKCKLYTARIHGIESVLHSNRPGGYSDDLKLEVVDSLMKGMTKHAAARTYNITKSTLIGKAVCRLVWNMGREENSRYLSSATAALEKASGAILEVPVGTGVSTLPIYRKMESVNITCLDYSGEMLEKAKRRAPVMDTSAHRGAP